MIKMSNKIKTLASNELQVKKSKKKKFAKDSKEYSDMLIEFVKDAFKEV